MENPCLKCGKTVQNHAATGRPKSYCSVDCRRAAAHEVRRLKPKKCRSYKNILRAMIVDQPPQDTACPVCQQTINRDSWMGYLKVYCSEACSRKAANLRSIARNKLIRKKVELKPCDNCGTPIARTGARGPVNKLCATCYTAKEQVRIKKNNQKRTDSARIARLKNINVCLVTTCQACGKYLPEKHGSGAPRKFCNLKCSRTVMTNLTKDARRVWREAWVKANPEKIRLYKDRGAPKRRERARAYHAKYSTSLGDPYIKHLLVQGTTISKKSVPQSLIDLKRVQVQITRALKELNK